MAVTNGNDYDHVDISKNGEVTRHHFKDASHFQATGRLVVGTGSATADYAVAEGLDTEASALYAHAEGRKTKATAQSAHAEGGASTASNTNSHAEGASTTASGTSAHSEGVLTAASGNNSHAEGSGSSASGNNSHAEGQSTTASGMASHAEGASTVANHLCQHVFGAGNIPDPSTAGAGTKGTYIEIVGNSLKSSVKSNARTLDWSGNEELAGDLTVNKGGANEASVSAIAGDVSTLKSTSLTAQQKQMLVGLFSSTANTGHTTGDPVVAGRYLLECNVSTATGKASMFNFRWVLQE